MRLFICFSGLFLMMTTVSGFADEVTSERPITEGEPFEKLTLDEHLVLVKANHPFFTKEELSVNIEEKQAESLLGGQDWIMSVTPSYSYLGEATAPEFQADERVHLAGVEAGLNRALWSTEGRLGFSVSTD